MFYYFLLVTLLLCNHSLYTQIPGGVLKQVTPIAPIPRYDFEIQMVGIKCMKVVDWSDHEDIRYILGIYRVNIPTINDSRKFNPPYKGKIEVRTNGFPEILSFESKEGSANFPNKALLAINANSLQRAMYREYMLSYMPDLATWYYERIGQMVNREYQSIPLILNQTKSFSDAWIRFNDIYKNQLLGLEFTLFGNICDDEPMFEYVKYKNCNECGTGEGRKLSISDFKSQIDNIPIGTTTFLNIGSDQYLELNFFEGDRNSSHIKVLFKFKVTRKS